jgi:hypothetical protein
LTGARAGGPHTELRIAVDRLVARVAHWTPTRWAKDSRAESVHALAQRLADAAAELAGRQLVLAPGAVADRGSVTRQNPAAGTRVAPGTAVTVEQAAPVAISGRGALTLPGVGLGVLALGVAAVVARAGRAKAGREWTQQHVRVVVRRRAVRR